MEDQANTWSTCGPTLCQSLDYEDPCSIVMVQGSGYSAYMNSALKFKLVGKLDNGALHYKHCRDKFHDLIFRPVMSVALAIKVTDKAGEQWTLQVSSAMSGNVMLPMFQIDCNTRIAGAKVRILDELVIANKATRGTLLIFVEPAENSGGKKLASIFKLKEPEPVKKAVIKTITKKK